MKTPLILLVSILCTDVVAHKAQHVLDSLDLSGNSYKCENGVKPSITCTDPSSNNHKCSCTCTNGIIFDQPLLSPAQLVGGSSSLLDDCQAEKTRYIDREQELVAELSEARQEHLKREQELLAELNTCRPVSRFKYQGCYIDGTDRRIIDDLYTNETWMTLERCANICREYSHYGLEGASICFCGNTTKRALAVAPENACSWPCKGNAKQICGGHTRLSLYSYT